MKFTNKNYYYKDYPYLTVKSIFDTDAYKAAVAPTLTAKLIWTSGCLNSSKPHVPEITQNKFFAVIQDRTIFRIFVENFLNYGIGVERKNVTNVFCAPRSFLAAISQKVTKSNKKFTKSE